VNDAGLTVAYDGSFPGFLCACAETLNARDPVPIPVPYAQAQTLFEVRTTVRRDDARATALWERLSRRITPGPMETLLEAFLSGTPGIDAAIAAVMRRMWRSGACHSLDISDPDALKVEKAANRAREESHRFCGLVRFSELSDGSFYAAVEPSCDILSLIGDHFARRFAPMRYAIHDTLRHSAILHEPGRSWTIIDGFSLALPSRSSSGGDTLDEHLSGRELEIRAMWKTYFRTIAIASRKNPRLQSSKVPLKYRSRLLEFTASSTAEPG
jgi:probable DNA metabolism protein